MKKVKLKFTNQSTQCPSESRKKNIKRQQREKERSDKPKEDEKSEKEK